MEILREILGPAPLHEGMTILNMVFRAAVVHLGGLLLVRSGKKRLLGRTTAFDIILAFILGSMLSRAINGGASSKSRPRRVRAVTSTSEPFGM